MKRDIRRSYLAGSWYPGNPDLLRSRLQELLENAPMPQPCRKIVGLIAPHAGYMYSGQVAAYAYKALTGQSYETVIVIAPSHRARFEGVSVYSRGGYETPLGVLEIDEMLADGLLSEGNVVRSLPEVHLQEHAVEIQLPFIQVLLGKVRLVPLIMGDQGDKTCKALADTIIGVVQGRGVLLVGSADLSHFHDYFTARRMDGLIVKRLAAMDERGLLGDLEAGLSESCGGGPMVTTLMAVKKLGAARAQVVHYANSGDVTGDRSSVVGYAAAVYCSDPS